MYFSLLNQFVPYTCESKEIGKALSNLNENDGSHTVLLLTVDISTTDDPGLTMGPNSAGSKGYALS